jgi:DNA-directed RNA polymerase III subunit RPC1
LQYDSTVRNSETTVVQFTYGDDGLHPDKMEDNDRPVDFERLRLRIREISPCYEEETLRADDLMRKIEEKLSEERFQMLLPTGKVFLQEIREYFSSLAAKQTALIEESGTDERLGIRSWHLCRVTESQLEMFLEIARKKCLIAYVEPGEAIGAIGAQSISEPGTQMTLKVGYNQETARMHK